MQFIIDIILYFVKTQEIKQISMVSLKKDTPLKYKVFMNKIYILSRRTTDQKKKFRKL